MPFYVCDGHVLTVGEHSFGPNSTLPDGLVAEMRANASRKGKADPISVLLDERKISATPFSFTRPEGPRKADSGEPNASVGGPFKWDFNPDVLNEKTLDQLQTLAIERDPKAPRFTTLADAIEFMSADFGKK